MFSSQRQDWVTFLQSCKPRWKNKHNRRFPLLWLVSLVFGMGACQPLNDSLTPTSIPTLILPPTPTTPLIETIALQATDIEPAVTLAQPIPPTPFPTATNLVRLPTPENWQTFIDPDSGLMLSAPPSWVNVGELSNTASLADAMGDGRLLVVTDQLETGVQLLTGRPFANGAFMMAFVPDEAGEALFPSNTSGDVGEILDNLLRAWGEDTTVQVVPQGRLAGASAYLNQDPTGMLAPDAQGVDLQVGVLVDTFAEQPTAIYLLFGEARSENGRYTPVFRDMLATLTYSPENNDTGESLRFLDVSATTGGQDAIIGRLPEGSVAYWAFEADAGRFATFNLTPDGESDLTLTLLSPSGRTIVEQDNGFGGDPEIVLDAQLPETGIYVIQVSEFFNVGDRYTLSVGLSDEPVYRNGGRIMLNQQLTGKLTTGIDDVWVFNGRAEQNVSVIVSPQNEFDIIFTLYGPDGVEILTYDEGYSGDAEVMGNYSLPFTGEYTIGVRSFGEIVGEYTIALDDGNQGVSNFYEAGDMVYGEVMTEMLRPEEAHVWFLTGRAGDLVTIDARPLSDKVDLDVWLLTLSLERLVMQDNGVGGESEQITHRLPRDGEYLVVVQDFFGESGDYEMLLTVSEEDYLLENGLVEPNQVFESGLPAGRGAIWQFEGRRGDVVSIVVRPMAGDTDFSLALRTPDNQPFLQSEASLAGGEESILSFELTADGVWSIVVQEYFDMGGEYELELMVE